MFLHIVYFRIWLLWQANWSEWTCHIKNRATLMYGYIQKENKMKGEKESRNKKTGLQWGVQSWRCPRAYEYHELAPLSWREWVVFTPPTSYCPSQTVPSSSFWLVFPTHAAKLGTRTCRWESKEKKKKRIELAFDSGSQSDSVSVDFPPSFFLFLIETCD